MDWIKFNGVLFNAKFYRTQKKEVFVKEEAHHKLSKEDTTTVWDLIQGKPAKAAEDKQEPGAE